MLVESEILGFGIRNPTKDCNLGSSTEYLELGIHGVESRAQDCRGSLRIKGRMEGPFSDRGNSKIVVITCQLPENENRTFTLSQVFKGNQRVRVQSGIVDEQNKEHGSVQEGNQWFLS